MSGVQAAASLHREPRCAPSEDVTAMQDQLYEILAAGVAPGPAIAIETVERFLHEHARAPKSRAEFEAFFTRCGLSPSPTALVPPEDGAFSVPAIGEAPEPAESDVTAAPPLEPPPPPLQMPRDDDFEAARPRPARIAPTALWAALCVVSVLLVVTLWVGHGVVTQLRGEVRQAHHKSTQNERVIDALQGQAAGIESGVAANGELIQRMDHKSDLLLQTLERGGEPASRR